MSSHPDAQVSFNVAWHATRSAMAKHIAATHAYDEVIIERDHVASTIKSLEDEFDNLIASGLSIENLFADYNKLQIDFYNVNKKYDEAGLISLAADINLEQCTNEEKIARAQLGSIRSRSRR